MFLLTRFSNVYIITLGEKKITEHEHLVTLQVRRNIVKSQHQNYILLFTLTLGYRKMCLFGAYINNNYKILIKNMYR